MPAASYVPMTIPPPEHAPLFLTGPAGRIEAVLDAPETDVTAQPVLAIVCHPLPTEGGTMPVSYTHLDVYKRQVARGVADQVGAGAIHRGFGHPADGGFDLLDGGRGFAGFDDHVAARGVDFVG